MENVGRQPGWGTVVAGVDESEHGRRALDYAATLAAGLDAEIILLRQVEALAAEQRDAWTRNELEPLAGLAARRAAVMHDLAALEARGGLDSLLQA